MDLLVAVFAAVLMLSSPGRATVITVGPDSSVQAGIDAAGAGDVVQVAPGVYDENLDFRGKAITVVGAGPSSVIRGTGSGPVVTFASGETAESVLDSLTITGGLAVRGGGVYVNGSDPTILRNVIANNRAVSQGSGVYLEASSASLFNNLIAYNDHAGGNPHSVEIQNAAPAVVNNTIVRGDSNGLILRGASPAVIMNNIIAQNGSVVAGSRRGRGICDFSGGTATIHYNLFWMNRVGALLTDGSDFGSIRRAEVLIGAPRLVGNVGGRPGFRIRRVPVTLDEVDADAFALRTLGRARDAGSPAPEFADMDGTRNDIGFTGGPLAPSWPVQP